MKRIDFRLPHSFPAGLGAPHATTRKLSHGAGNFQELKICGHGAVLALTVRMIRLALTVRMIRLALTVRMIRLALTVRMIRLAPVVIS